MAEMTPGPATPDCHGCHQRDQQLSQNSLIIAELQGRIGTLHSIQQTEKFLDSWMPDQDATTCGGPSMSVELSPPVDPWSMPGGRLRELRSTPRKQEPWTVVRASKRARDPARAAVPPPTTIPLRNSFAGLVDEDSSLHLHTPVRKRYKQSSYVSRPSSPQPPGQTVSPPPSHHLHPASVHFTPIPTRPHAAHRPPKPRPDPARQLSPVPGRHQRNPHPHQQQRPTMSNNPPESVHIMGSSMIRHVRVPGALTHCSPGATVSQINTAIAPLIMNHPETSSIIIHVGANDIKLQQSERLKKDFMTLIDTTLDTGKACIISGPFPSPQYGHVKYSRIRQLHLWLKGYCRQLGVPYVDNFTTFLDRRDLFARDGLHPNRSGARLLSLNMELTLRSRGA